MVVEVELSLTKVFKKSVANPIYFSLGPNHKHILQTLPKHLRVPKMKTVHFFFLYVIVLLLIINGFLFLGNILVSTFSSTKKW